MDNNETRDRIAAEAIDSDKLQLRGNGSEGLYYAQNQEMPFTGWERFPAARMKLIARLSQYKDGKKNGLEKKWNYASGSMTEERTYKDGKIDGLEILWYPNGQKWQEHTYKDGKKDGLATVWTDNGQKVSELTWEDDDKLMTAVAWKPNGEKCPVTNVVNGNGVKVWYNNDGTEIYRLTYKDGETVRD